MNNLIKSNNGFVSVDVLPFQKKGLRHYLLISDIRKVLSTVDNPMHYTLLDLMFKTGIRVTEVISLCKKDIDFQNQMLKIRYLKSRKYLERIIPLHSSLVPTLRIFTASLNLDDKLFPVNRQRVWQITQKYFNSHPHVLRHSFAVHFLFSGGQVTTLCALLGHKYVNTTMEYAKIAPIDQKNSIEGISWE
jgi:site-specific recombinase XerD